MPSEKLNIGYVLRIRIRWFSFESVNLQSVPTLLIPIHTFIIYTRLNIFQVSTLYYSLNFLCLQHAKMTLDIFMTCDIPLTSSLYITGPLLFSSLKYEHQKGKIFRFFPLSFMCCPHQPVNSTSKHSFLDFLVAVQYQKQCPMLTKQFLVFICERKGKKRVKPVGKRREEGALFHM